MQQIFKGAELSDLHISAFQNLLKQKFPHLGGLQSPLYQEKTSLKLDDRSTTLQVIHTRSSHWAALQVCGGTGGDVCLYDSVYTGMVTHTLKVIAQLIRSSDSSIRVQLMNTSKQTGSADCGLYAPATLTCIAFDIDPVTVIFDQQQLRPHLAMCLEKGDISTFPVLKHRRPVNRVLRTELCNIYCYCRLPDDGQTMVCCDSCQDWYHVGCLSNPSPVSN